MAREDSPPSDGGSCTFTTSCILQASSSSSSAAAAAAALRTWQLPSELTAMANQLPRSLLSAQSQMLLGRVARYAQVDAGNKHSSQTCIWQRPILQFLASRVRPAMPALAADTFSCSPHLCLSNSRHTNCTAKHTASMAASLRKSISCKPHAHVHTSTHKSIYAQLLCCSTLHCGASERCQLYGLAVHDS